MFLNLHQDISTTLFKKTKEYHHLTAHILSRGYFEKSFNNT